MIIFAAGGGTGIEDRAAATRRIPCDVNGGPLDSTVDEAVASCGLSAKNAKQLNESIRKLLPPRAASKRVRLRSIRWLTKGGEFVAADCRITIDDYAVARIRARDRDCT
jgi:Succinyl-CoA synthetase, beta subunit